MIGTVTANPCLDKTVSVKEFDLYKMNRVHILAKDPSGKGINVSKTLHVMGVNTFCTGFDFATGTSLLEADLDRDGIPHDFVTLPGELRICTKIFDESRRHTIEVNEGGAAVTPADGEKLLEKIKEVAKRCDFLTLSGSLPKGLSKDFYAKCVAAVGESAPACRVVVDCEGEMLLCALREHPFFIKPNIHELESTFGCKIKDLAHLDAVATRILEEYGLGIICVSMGADGAYISTRQGAYACKPAPVEVRSLQGAGDALVAGICTALERELPLPEVLRYGVCMAGAAVATEGTRPGTRAHFEALLQSELYMEQLR